MYVLCRGNKEPGAATSKPQFEVCPSLASLHVFALL